MIWEHSAPTRKDPNSWKDNMKALGSFKTVEGFWQYFNHIPKPASVFYTMEAGRKCFSGGKMVEEYSLFKKGIEPEWGDPENRIGGEFYTRGNMEPDQLNAYWQNLVFAVVGEYLESSMSTCGGCDKVTQNHEDGCVVCNCCCKNIVNGVRVVDKSKQYPMYKLELWLNTKNADVKDRLRARLNEVVVDSVPAPRKGHPSFDWKDHS